MSKPGALTAQRYESQARQSQVGISNVAMNKARFSQSASTLQVGSEIIGRLNELATRAADSSLSNDDRAAFNAEASALHQEINDLMGSSKFNGNPLLDGSTTTAYAGDSVSVQDADGSSITSPLAGLDLSTQAGAEAALTQIKGAQQALSEGQATVGASLDRLGRASALAQSKTANLQSVASGLIGTDVASEIGKMQKYIAQQKITQAIESLKNDQTKSLDDFLDSD